MGGVCSAENDGDVEKVDAIPMVATGAQESPEEEQPVQQDPAPAKPQFHVNIIGARGLRNTDWFPGFGMTDCYIVIKAGGKELYTTQVVKDSLEPQWREVAEITEYDGESDLEFHAFDKDLVSSETLGKAVLAKNTFLENGFNGEVEIENTGVGDRPAHLHLTITLPGKSLPAKTSSTEGQVSVEKGSFVSWGLELDLQDPSYLFVIAVNDGPFSSYSSASPEARIKQGDFIWSVNGVTGDTKKMLDEIRAAKKVEVKFLRGFETRFAVERTSDQALLGLIVGSKPTGNHLVILRVEGGTIGEYNDNQKIEALKFQPSDRITAVGGATGNSTELLSKMGGAGKYQISVLRPITEETKRYWDL